MVCISIHLPGPFPYFVEPGSEIDVTGNEIDITIISNESIQIST